MSLREWIEWRFSGKVKTVWQCISLYPNTSSAHKIIICSFLFLIRCCNKCWCKHSWWQRFNSWLRARTAALLALARSTFPTVFRLVSCTHCSLPHDSHPRLLNPLSQQGSCTTFVDKTCCECFTSADCSPQSSFNLILSPDAFIQEWMDTDLKWLQRL